MLNVVVNDIKFRLKRTGMSYMNTHGRHLRGNYSACSEWLIDVAFDLPEQISACMDKRRPTERVKSVQYSSRLGSDEL